MSPEGTGREFTAALNTRRASAVALASIGIITTVFLALTPDDPFPIAQFRLNLATAALLIPMAMFRRTVVADFTAVSGMYLLAVSSAFSTPLSDARLSASNMLFLAGMFGVTLVSGWLQWVWVLAIAATWLALVPSVPLVVTIFGAPTNLRWITLAQLVLACLWLMRAWNRESALIRLRDKIAQQAEANALTSAASRERTRVWRESLVRLHETVLNDIRSVLDASDIDASRLRRQIEQSTLSAPPRLAGGTLHDVVASLSAVSGSNQRLIVGRLDPIRLTLEHATALRSVLIEVLRNAFRHTDVTTVRISAMVGDDALQLTLLDDRSHVIPEEWSEGIGLGVVVRETLAAINATISVHDGSTVIDLPLNEQERPRPSVPTSDLGRVIISSGAAGNALGGAAAFGALALSTNGIGALTGLLALIGAALGAYVTWRRSTASRIVIALSAVIATAVPLLSRSLIAGCSQVELPVIVATLSTMSLGAVIVWAPSMRWWWLGLGSSAAMLYLMPTALNACSRSVVPGFVASLLTPAIMVTISFALHRSARHENRLMQLRRYEVQEEAAAVAARDFAEDLHTAVESARKLMLEIADAGAATNAQSRQLRCLDAEIRSAIQVDPETAGGMTSALRSCIRQASQAGVPVRVLTLRDSGDRTALPCEVVDMACALLLASADGEATVQVLSSGGEDTLVITSTSEAALTAGVATHWAFAMADGEATLDAGDADEPSVMMVRRAAGKTD